MTLKLSQEVLNRRKFNQYYYDLHTKDYMVGRTEPYLDSERNALDIGAAVGLYSTFWAPKVNHITSYEAVEPVYNQLKKLESQFDNITTKNIAVGENPGTFEFWVDHKRLSNSSFRNLVDGQRIEVEVTTIDLENHENIGFIKIDVEGHELEVLRGGADTVDRDRPVCMIEIYPKFNNGPVKDTFDFFFEKGYNCFYNLKQKGLHEVSNSEHGSLIAENDNLQKEHDGDFLFIPGESMWQ